jgi:hypothetical protein
MADIITTITSHAVLVFRERAEAYKNVPQWQAQLASSYPVLDEAQKTTSLLPARRAALDELADLIFAQPEFAAIAPQRGQQDPFILHPRGGTRVQPKEIVMSVFYSAFLQMYFLGLPDDESTFVRTVLGGFEELRRALRGEEVRCNIITGMSNLRLPAGKQISTPWGILKSAPPVNRQPEIFLLNQINTTCILIEQKLMPIKFDRAAAPQHKFETEEPSRAGDLLPLACALASKEPAKPVVPVVLWSTFVLPFQFGFNYSYSLAPPMPRKEVDFSDRISELEEWARLVKNGHAASVDIAARRLVSAVAHRLDRSDSLIDAMMVWENLVGTSQEVTFRVSAALSKLLEKDPNKRRALRKTFSDVYGIRSKLVHGATVNSVDIENACSSAISVAVQALQVSYSKGREWLSLSSNERSDIILLEWQ